MPRSVDDIEASTRELVDEYHRSLASEDGVSRSRVEFVASVLISEAYASAQLPARECLTQLHLVMASVCETGRRRGDELVQLRMAERTAQGDPTLSAMVTSRIDQWYGSPRAFLSYAREDVAAVTTIVEVLSAAGIDVTWDQGFGLGDLSAEILRHMAWVAFEDVLQPWDAVQESLATMVAEAVRCHGYYLVCWSASYAAKQWTMFELAEVATRCDRLARQSGPSVATVFLNLDGSAVPERFRSEVYVDCGETSAWRSNLPDVLRRRR
ncbi:MAG: toll/interleukin-1 receptor domain-containing protein [Alphaproteobacteria bacterium]|nr:toll/interleukin-1 receptor domain-containing protein [Alphaproteobacteria bacterium]